jgi:predicted transcriptional regulator
MERREMSVLTITLASRDSVSRRVLDAFAGKQQGAHLSFATPELLWKVLSVKRWELLKAMTGKGPVTVRGLARSIGRDAKGVESDVRALLKVGVIDRAENTRFVFPHEAIHVDFVLRAA